MTRKVDLLLLTALTEEQQVVEAVLDLAGSKARRENELALYDYTYEGHVFRVGALSAHHQGAVHMGLFASSALGRIKPQLAALVGIAAAVDLNEVGLGDVPCTRMVLSYDDLKVSGGTLTIRSDGYSTDQHLVGAVESIRSNKKSYRPWQKQCRKQIAALVKVLNASRPAEAPDKQIKVMEVERDPHIMSAITGGGPFLLADADFRDSLLKPRKSRRKVPRHKDFKLKQPLHPKLVSAEMESHGFMQAAAFHRIPAIVLKGISDTGDGRKAAMEKRSGGFFRAYACANATLAALHMLRFVPPEQRRPVAEKSLLEEVSDHAHDVFTWGNPIVVHGEAEQYAQFAENLLGHSVTYVLWTVNGSPLDIADKRDENDLTAWDRAFERLQCEKRRLVVFRTEEERLAYISPKTKAARKRLKAFTKACGDALCFTSVPQLHHNFKGLASEDALDVGYVTNEGRGICFCSPFATRDLGEQIPTRAPIVIFTTDVHAPDPHGNDHEESGVLLRRLNAYRYFIRALELNPYNSWLYSNPSEVPEIPAAVSAAGKVSLPASNLRQVR